MKTKHILFPYKENVNNYLIFLKNKEYIFNFDINTIDVIFEKYGYCIHDFDDSDRFFDYIKYTPKNLIFYLPISKFKYINPSKIEYYYSEDMIKCLLEILFKLQEKCGYYCIEPQNIKHDYIVIFDSEYNYLGDINENTIIKIKINIHGNEAKRIIPNFNLIEVIEL